MNDESIIIRKMFLPANFTIHPTQEAAKNMFL